MLLWNGEILSSIQRLRNYHYEGSQLFSHAIIAYVRKETPAKLRMQRRLAYGRLTDFLFVGG